MTVLVVGISHRSAPVAVLERVAAAHPTGHGWLAALAGTAGIDEAVVAATCNRIEVYADVDRFHPGVDAITHVLVSAADLPREELAAHLYVHFDDAAVEHLFEVAAGLDSMVVGEGQILGQVRSAYRAAHEAGTAGRSLGPLFQAALRVGKRARAETGIDRAGANLVQAGLSVAAPTVGGLAGRRALVVGAGSMGALAVATLVRAGVERVDVVNRSVEAAQRLAEPTGGTGWRLAGLRAALAEADVAVCSTGASGMVVHRADVVAARARLAEPAARPLAVIDLALPHDVDPSVARLPGVTLVGLAHLQETLGGAGRAPVAHVRALVAEETGAYLAWQRSTRAAPTVVALRAKADEVVSRELARLDARLPDLDRRSRAEVAAAVNRVVDKLLHAPTVRVRQLAEQPGGESYARALHELFGLDAPAVGVLDAVSVRMADAAEPGVDLGHGGAA